MSGPSPSEDRSPAQIARDAPAKDAAEESGRDIVRDDLDTHERRIVEKHETASAKLVHEIIRQRGIAELERPASALLWSAIGAGLAIGISPFAMAVVAHAMPGSPALPLLLALGYAMGFIAVIAGRMQLFTESTLTAVLPLATTPCWSNLARTLRLWGLVFAGNVAGTFLFALIVHFDIIHQPEIAALIQSRSAETIRHLLAAPFLNGIPAGFLLAVLVWASPNLEKQELVLIVLVTGLMSLSEVGHSVVGSAEMWVAVLHGDFSLVTGVFGFLLPAALGNLVGGAVLFALLAHAQVASEIETQSYRYGDRRGGSDAGDDRGSSPR